MLSKTYPAGTAVSCIQYVAGDSPSNFINPFLFVVYVVPAESAFALLSHKRNFTPSIGGRFPPASSVSDVQMHFLISDKDRFFRLCFA